MAEGNEVKSLIEQQGQAFEQFKAANDERLKQIEARGSVDPVLAEQVDKLNSSISALQAKLDQVEKSAARPAKEDDANGLTPEHKAQKEAFFGYMRGERIPQEQRGALVEDATGEILVPEDVDREIQRAIGKITVMREICRVRPTTSNRVRRRSMNEVVVGWGRLETGAALAEGTLTPAEAYQYVEDQYGLTRIGEDELMDTDVALEGYVEDSFARALAEQEDTGFVIGTGTANDQPEGVLNGAVVARVAAGQAAAITADDVIALAYAVPAQFRRNGSYLMSSTTEQALRGLTDANGQYLWQPSLQAGTPASFNGRPVRNQEDVPGIPAGGTAADVVIFGDFFAGYRIVDRLRMTIKRLAELYATQGMVGFLAHRRVTGGVVEPNALRVLQVPAA